MNYVTEIERELQELYSRTERFKIALDVIKELRQREIPITEAVAETLAERKALAAPKSKRTRKKHAPNVQERIQKVVLDALAEFGAPVRSKPLLDVVMSRIEASDTSFWYATKKLRDAGIITWDTETRLYALVQPRNTERAAS